MLPGAAATILPLRGYSFAPYAEFSPPPSPDIFSRRLLSSAFISTLRFIVYDMPSLSRDTDRAETRMRQSTADTDIFLYFMPLSRYTA